MSIKKEVYSGKKVSFFYDLDGKLIAEKDLSNGNWTDYIYNGLEPVAQVKNQPPWVSIGNFFRADKTGGKVHLDWTLYGGSENFRIYRSINDFTFSNPSVIQELTAKTFDDDVLYDGNNYAYKIYKNVPTEVLYYYHTDHLMTPLFMTDDNQEVVWQAEYYPFGRLYSESGSEINKIRLPGQYYDFETKLHQNWHRYYNAKLGRYFSTDPILTKFELSNYNYANSNPITYFDLTGLKAGDICTNITIKRKNIHKSGEDRYGHWWIEMGNESYGWWPEKPLNLKETIIGVNGILNGQGVFEGGTATRDPHHGKPAEEVFHPRIDGSSNCECWTCKLAENCIRKFAKGYRGKWSWPLGPNCHTFQKDAMKNCCLKK